jgi:transposase-like protein
VRRSCGKSIAARADVSRRKRRSGSYSKDYAARRASRSSVGREGLPPNLYYRWSKEFLEAGRKRLLGDTTREATAPEVKTLREENARLKQVLAETVLENRLLKKSVTASDSEDDTCP